MLYLIHLVSLMEYILKNRVLTPGPVAVPEFVMLEMAKPLIHHRTSEFEEIFYNATEDLKKLFQTKEEVLILASSGTGAMEAAVTNTLSPGERVLCASIGSFGDRFGSIAEIFGAQVTKLNFEQGTAVDIDTLRRALDSDPDITSVLVTHNETNTGVTNDLEAIAKVVKTEFNKLLLVDGISSVCSIPLKTDEWGLDVVATASQKGWMLPPGLAFISMSERAWHASQSSKMPKLYFDLTKYKEYYDIGQPPWTPNLSAIFALDFALGKLLEEGIEEVWRRHSSIARMTREGIVNIGLSVFPDEQIASNTVTAVRSPAGVDADNLRSVVLKNHDVVLAGAYGELKGKMFRIGHLGYVTPEEINEMLVAIEAALQEVC